LQADEVVILEANSLVLTANGGAELAGELGDNFV
jgi:hypothetical protein